MNKENFHLVVAGISYKTSNITDREKYQIGRKEISQALMYFQSRNDIEGSIVISTCNRIEFYLVLNQTADVLLIINDFYLQRNNTGIDKSLFYSYSEGEVASHLFRVVTGLDSMLLGEYQIQGQVKECYSIACSNKSADKILHKLFHAAFRVGKNLRTETKIGSGKQSLSGIAFEIITEKLKQNDLITIIGVNDNSKIIAEKLNKSGFNNLAFVNRTAYKAEELADRFSGKAFALTDIEKILCKTKCLFSCTGAPGYVVTSGELNKSYSKSNCPELIIDMAIPHDIEFNLLNKSTEYIDLERLRNFLVEQQNEIASDLSKAEKIIADAANVFEVWSDSQKDGHLSYVAEKAEMIRLQLLDETRSRITESEFKLLDKFSRSLIHRVNSTFNQPVVIKELQDE
jgi:glutamyl-tRNA reductase